MAFEFRLGPYLPRLPNVKNYTPSFGDELARNRRVMLGFEIDWQALRLPKILNLGPGFGTSYTKMANDGTYLDAQHPYTATLKLWTQWLEAVLRVDALQKQLDVPFVFTAKLGAARASWWSGERRPNSSAINQRNSGSAQGLAWALGAMIDLGFLEPTRAREMDTISGINHMYLFWEWYQFRLDDFGRGQDQLGDSTWALGWAADM